MKVLLTGSTGYIAKRLLPVLIADGHEIICCVRDVKRFDIERYDKYHVGVIEVNFLERDSLKKIPDDIDVAYYLIHSMSSSIKEFEKLEERTAELFRDRIEKTNVKQVIYLSGIVNEDRLSRHLTSRRKVEVILSKGKYDLTTLRAGIIIGSGSASFEIMRDLVEKLPVMIAPKWLKTKSQPIAVKNVIEFLKGVILNPNTFNQSFDIGGPEILNYKEMLLRFAKVRNLKRRIWIVPVMTPKLSSYWLYFVTSTSYKLAVNLVNSMKVEVVCRENKLDKWLGIERINYEKAIEMAFDKIEQQDIVSSWTDALSSKTLEKGILNNIEVPIYGCYRDERKTKLGDEEEVLRRIWSIGGENGWYYANWLWSVRGFIDKLFGGVGLRRGRRNDHELKAGDSLDFWRVLYANKEKKRLLLYAEMKLPGEAWLEFKIREDMLWQTATFRPLGLWGRLYWYMLWPFHIFIFEGMMKKMNTIKT